MKKIDIREEGLLTMYCKNLTGIQTRKNILKMTAITWPLNKSIQFKQN